MEIISRRFVETKWHSRLGVVERSYERSLIASSEPMTAEQRLEILDRVQDLTKTYLAGEQFNVEYTHAQYTFLDTLLDSGASTEDAQCLLRAVLSFRGFVCPTNRGTVPCHCGAPEETLPMSHFCVSRHSKLPQKDRDNEAEVMTLLLRMHPENPNWHTEVAGYFEQMFTDDFNTTYLGYSQWVDAIDQGVFSPDLPYSLLRNLTVQD
jgi:hypothetical protein